ncbi:NAD(P)-binding protein [Irpex rosettiformis]|uniref:NAD(P)-binding protein n=1 Tax=Irpex rosettiformis TaxID=378272 RepID=A0ACB8TWI2_9APHY|nr:NAD(P)-binding protein [Irpex rosettiformis]
MTESIPSPRVWLITGSSSGFGKALTECALSKGDIVVATLRKPEVLKELQDRTSPEKLLVLKVDVTKEEDVLNAFAKAKERFGRIDVVINNAGYSMGSVVEATPEDAARAIFETNFWGATRVSREAVRTFRDSNPAGTGGRLIVISSSSGLRPLPITGYYGATKHALEAITQSLVEELDPNWNIKVTLVEAGAFRSSAIQSAPRLPTPEVYMTPTSGLAKLEKLFGHLMKPDAKMGDTVKFAEKVWELLALPNPPLRLPLGLDSIDFIEGQLKIISTDLEEYRSWSEDVNEK